MQALWRVPIRLRLTAAFALVVAAVFLATGAFVYGRMRADLERTVDTGLRSRASDIVALFQRPDGSLEASRSLLTERGENLAQVLSAGGAVLDATPQYRAAALITPEQFARARHGTIFVERRQVTGLDSPVRLVATPFRSGDTSLVAVVGALLDDRDEALHRLFVLLRTVGPVALLFTVLAGYGVAVAALRPVEAMRREAAAVSASEPGRRLPVPPARDEIGRLGTSLNEMLARLEAAFERERTFVSDASHELRTPLSILRTELELALQQGRSAEELRAAVRSSVEETDRLTHLAEDLLVLARMDHGTVRLRLEAVPAADLCATVETRFADRVRAAGRALTVECALDTVLRLDRPRVEQALTNLVDNALRYGEGDVLIDVRYSPGWVEVHVLDRGAGFDPNFLGRAFERFSRADHARARGGVGLGLAIVAAIAAAHGGAAHARDREGGGADVWLGLPTAPDAGTDGGG